LIFYTHRKICCSSPDYLGAGASKFNASASIAVADNSNPLLPALRATFLKEEGF
jgi:hypothetical protein